MPLRRDTGSAHVRSDPRIPRPVERMTDADRHAIAPDGTRIAWERSGAGRPAVVLCDGIGCAGYIWRHLAPALSAERRVIHWTYRGHGESDPPRDPARVGIPDCVDDLLAVLDAAGERAAVLAGHSMGVQVALEAHRRAPGRVRGLILVCGAPGHTIDSFHDSPALRLALPWARALVDLFPGAARAVFQAVVPTELALQYALAFEVDGSRVAREDMVRYLGDLSRIDPTLFVRMLAAAGEHDATDHLPAVDVPTLVVAGERDTFTPMRLSEAMHQAIRGSELLVLPGGTHVAPLEHPALLREQVLAFLRSRLPVRRRRAPAPVARSRAPGRRPRGRRPGAGR